MKVGVAELSVFPSRNTAAACFAPNKLATDAAIPKIVFEIGSGSTDAIDPNPFAIVAS
jgi:hypothetical protein